MPAMQIVLYILVAISAVVLLMQMGAVWQAHKARGRPAPDTSLVDGEAAPYPRRLYYFYGRHCGPCKALSPLIERVSQDHPNLVKVDVGHHWELAKRFGVSATPTFMLVEDGLIQKVKLGGMRESRLRALLA